MATRDYLAAHFAKKADVKHHGVKGMKWGIRRSKAQLKAAAAKRGESESSTKTDHTKKTDGPETAPQRYARLKEQAKDGKAGALSDEDLKWFNARTEALSKINKLNKNDPNWLKKTVNEVTKNVAKSSIQTVADAAKTKYITEPLTKALAESGKPTFDQRVQAAAQKAVDEKAFADAVEAAKKRLQPRT